MSAPWCTNSISYNYCWGEWIENSEDSGGGIIIGGGTDDTGGGIGSESGSVYTPSTPTNCDGGGGVTILITTDNDSSNNSLLCDEAAFAAYRVSNLCLSSIYGDAKTSILAANQTVENSVTFGTSASGNYTASTITSCNSPSTCTVNTSWPGAFADLHNHPNNLPPSPGDLYGLITINNHYVNYNTRIVLTQDGSVYALVLLNLAEANSFIVNYPSEDFGFGPDFPNEIFNKFQSVKMAFMLQGFSNIISEERAMAFVLTKFNTGFALLKQDSFGNFKRLITIENTYHGQTFFSANNCQ